MWNFGRYIDEKNKVKTRKEIQKLVEITPETATIIRNEIETIITLDEIKKGDVLIAKPGQKIAVDGEIIERTCTFWWIIYNRWKYPYFKRFR